jgi:hypothetical protein
VSDSPPIGNEATRFGSEQRPGGAPVGNQNARKGTRWRNAIEAAIEQWARDKGLKTGNDALRELACSLLKAVASGDINAARELGDRLDGKVKQEVEHSGSMGVIVYKPDADDAELG